jgi:hypothetical protein
MGKREAPDGKAILVDASAASASPSLPAFVARPAGEPVYSGFPLIEATRKDGWCFGAITDFADPDGCEAGDGFVEAPDGSRAGLIWSVGSFSAEAVCPPDSERWGVYEVAFPHAVRNTEDLAECFHALLPELRAIHEQATVELANLRVKPAAPTILDRVRAAWRRGLRGFR